jgi:hypothetical protein
MSRMRWLRILNHRWQKPHEYSVLFLFGAELNKGFTSQSTVMDRVPCWCAGSSGPFKRLLCRVEIWNMVEGWDKASWRCIACTSGCLEGAVSSNWSRLVRRGENRDATLLLSLVVVPQPISGVLRHVGNIDVWHGVVWYMGLWYGVLYRMCDVCGVT